MIQPPNIVLKGEGLPSKGLSGGKLSAALSGLGGKLYVNLTAVALLVGIYFGARCLYDLSHGRKLAATSWLAPFARTVPAAPAAAVPMAGKRELEASAPPPAPVRPETDSPKSAAPGFADSLMSVISPSAKGETIQPEFPAVQTAQKLAAVSASRLPLSVPAAPVRHEPPPLTAEQQRLLIAQTGFNNVMDWAYKYPDAYGFGPDESLQAARLGDPIPVYTITPLERGNYQAGQPVKPLLQSVDEWVYPIMLGDRIRFMVQVKTAGQKYVLGNGSRALAMVYEKILARWPASEGFHPQLIVHADRPSYFFTIPELPAQNITDTSDMFGLNPTLSPATVMLSSWRY
jgi:hypothetical protein